MPGQKPKFFFVFTSSIQFQKLQGQLVFRVADLGGAKSLLGCVVA